MPWSGGETKERHQTVLTVKAPKCRGEDEAWITK